MTGSWTIAVVPLLLASLEGCISVPTPVDVVQSCNREQASIRADTHGSSRNYHEKVQARCVDDERHGAAAIVEQRSNRKESADAMRYEARDGHNGTEVSVIHRADDDTYQSSTRIVIRDKWGAWIFSSGFLINGRR